MCIRDRGIPAGIGVLVALVAALTLAPALLSIGRHFGLFEPGRAMRTQGWRRIGTAIVRWPGPILVVTVGVALIGLVALPGYKTSYDARPYMPANAPANIGYAAAEDVYKRQPNYQIKPGTELVFTAALRSVESLPLVFPVP